MARGIGVVKGHGLTILDYGPITGRCECGKRYPGPTRPKVRRQHSEHLWEVRHAPAATSQG